MSTQQEGVPLEGRTFDLPWDDMVITITPALPQEAPLLYHGELRSGRTKGAAGEEELDAALDGAESFLLALACEGVDLDDPRIHEAYWTTLNAITHNY